MKVFKNHKEAEELRNTKNCVTLGNFDGVHIGHREVICRVLEKAKATSSKSVLVTFFPHPLKVLAPERAPCILQPLEERLETIAETGIDAVYLVDFTVEFSRFSPEDFIREYLVDALNIGELFVGGDVLFGHNRKGNIETFREFGLKYGFVVNEVGPVYASGVKVGSSLIRKLVAKGDMERVSLYLGRDFSIKGRVVYGDALGSKIGFPTANIATEVECLPVDGVYAGKVFLDGRMLTCAVHIGARPTLGIKEKTIEAHILDFSDDIYGKEIRVFFVKKLRDIVKFDNNDALVTAVKSDINSVRELFSRT